MRKLVPVLGTVQYNVNDTDETYRIRFGILTCNIWHATIPKATLKLTEHLGLLRTIYNN